MRPKGRSSAMKSQQGSQDVKWKGPVLARPAAELAHGKGSFRSSPEADGLQIQDFISDGLSSFPDGAAVNPSSAATEIEENFFPQ